MSFTREDPNLAILVILGLLYQVPSIFYNELIAANITDKEAVKEHIARVKQLSTRGKSSSR